MIITRVTSVLERIRIRRKARQAARRKAPLITPAPVPTITLTKAEAKALDAYYTRPHVAKFVANALRTFATKDAFYLEPTAGGGAILDQFPGAIGLDLCPTRDDIIQADFLTADVAKVAGLTADQRKRLVIVGNPPFGKGARQAVAFLNRSLELASTVGFILPICMGYHALQREVTRGARLVVDVILPKAGYTLAGKAANVAARFQVWTTDPTVSPGYVYEGRWSKVGHKPRIIARPVADLRRQADALESEDLRLVRWRAGKIAPRFAVAFPFTKVRDYAAQMVTRAADLIAGRDYWLIMAKAGAGAVIERLKRVDLKAIANLHHHRGQRFVGVDIVQAIGRIASNDVGTFVPANQNEFYQLEKAA
jgi:predicted RNA methylase